MGFEHPTDIQKQAIPRLLGEEKDLIGIAQTGTGKTAAFGLPLLERVDPEELYTQGHILAPTRELGKQIAEQIRLFGKYLDKINVLVVYGGAPIRNQIRALRKPQHVIIATPGRLIDLIHREAVELESLRYLILDEADEMMNMGFKEELDEILSYTPEDKKTWLFSATMPSFIKKIVKKYMTDPIEISIDAKNQVNKNIEHLYTIVRRQDKQEAMMRFLDVHEDMRGVVFCRTRRDTQELAEVLQQKGYRSDALHGDLSQAQRDRVMRRFRDYELQVLIATDVAARGIDVNDLTHVFHFSLPDELAYYTHRSGRTARAGKKGTSVSLISNRELHRIRKLEKQLSIEMEQVLIPSVEDITEIRMFNWATNFLQAKEAKKLDKQLVDHMRFILDDLSKDDLIKKIVSREITRLNLGEERDLNDRSSPKERKGKRRDKDGRGGRGRGGGGGRGGFKKKGRGNRATNFKKKKKKKLHKGNKSKD